MNCHEFRELLEQGIEDRSAVAVEAQRHSADCPDGACASLLQDAGSLDVAIDAWSAARPRVDLADRVLTDWRGGRTPAVTVRAVSAQPMRTTVRGGNRHAALTIAICALGVLSLAAAVLSTSSRQSRPIADEPIRPEPVRPELESVPLDNGLGEEQLANQDAVNEPEETLETVGRSYVGLVQNATNVVSDMVALAFCGDQELEDPTPAVDWVDDWRANLQPVRDEVDGTVDEILETIPKQRIMFKTWLPDLPS